MIRDATSDDAQQIANIYNYYIANTVVTFEEAEISALEIQRRMEQVLANGHPWLVAAENAEIAGYAYSNEWNVRPAYRYSAEVTVYLSHRFTGRGFGTALYKELFNRLRSMSIHCVIGGISLPNPTSIALHEKFGMQRAALYEEVGFKFDRWIDVGYWQVLLNG